MITANRVHARALTAAVLAVGAVSATLVLVAPRASAAGIGAYAVAGALVLTAATVAGVRGRHVARSRPWQILAAATALYATGCVIQYGWPLAYGREADFPSVADALLLAAAALFLVGLAALVRIRHGRWHSVGSLIDSAILSIGVGVLCWELFVDPLVSARGSSFAAGVALAYTGAAVALVVPVATLVRGRRPWRALTLITGFVATNLASSAMYVFMLAHQGFHLAQPLVVSRLASFGFLAAAFLDPSSPELGYQVRASDGQPSRRRIALLAFASALIPGVYVVTGNGSDFHTVLVVTSVVFALCIARMATLVREIGRTAEAIAMRERDLTRTVRHLHQSEAHVARLAHHDPLTGLPNRLLFSERLDAAIACGAPTVVMLLDIDGFKHVNDSLGHAAGDALLVEVGARLASALRSADTVARLGGDEFTVLLEGLDADGAAALARRLLDAVRAPALIEGHEVMPRASLGIAVTGCAREGAELLREADAAMYEAKRKGGQCFELFTEDLHARAIERLALECDLNAARPGADLTLNYQPIVNLTSGRVTGFEALLRWRHPERGPISPAAFIPVAEETGQIVPIGRWVLQEACSKIAGWGRGRAQGEELGANVNVSARQLAQLSFVDDVAEVLAETGLEPRLLTLEVTETMVMTEEDVVFECLHRLSGLGVRISVDDFGTGYSSLAHLRRFPVDELKIDRSFVSAIGHGGDGAGVAFATLGLARSLRLEVVAEGIEEEEQLVQLRRAHCTSGQGYYLWRPMDAAAVESLLTELDAAGVPAVPAPRVLVVDDDPVCRATTARLLANAGLEVTEATNGLDCLEMAARLAPDAIVVDVRLPDLDGVEVCRSVKSAPGNSPAVICVSGAAIDVEERSYGLDSGADAYLVKPVAPIELVAVVRAGIRARDERVVVAGVA